ncbi:MAG: MoaD/ThiS family protein [Chloroflexi bacterium]|nr:MoaD/ThiS family protein [Chloroflexota bacterium]
MQVKVKLTEPIWRTVGSRDTEVKLPVDQASVGRVLDELAQQHPKFGAELYSGTSDGDYYYSLFLNDTVVNLVDRERVYAKDGDEVFILLPVAGGLSSWEAAKQFSTVVAALGHGEAHPSDIVETTRRVVSVQFSL